MRKGDLVLYKRRGCESYELGVVKEPLDGGGAFVWYSGGDTAAKTPADCLIEFENAALSVIKAHVSWFSGIDLLRLVHPDDMEPCPFCGSERVFANKYDHGCGRIRWRAMCCDCMGQVDTGTFQTMGQAVSAWNARAERTYHHVGDEVSGGCSECHGWLDPGCVYCPSCGAKVVSE